MPRPEDDDVPAAPTEQDDIASDASDHESDPSDRDAQSSAATDDSEVSRTLRDIQTRHGRELAEATRRAQQAERTATALAQKVAAQEQYLVNIGQHLSQQEAARQAAYLQGLKPEDRLAAQYRLLQQRVDTLSRGQGPAPSAQSQYSDAEIEAYKQQKSAEILKQANDDFGLDDTDGVTGDMPGLNWDDEEVFRTSVRKLARQRALGQGGTVPQDKQPTRKASANDIGGRPNAARPTGGSRGPVNVENEANRVFNTTTNRTSKYGIKARKQQLIAVRDRAREALDRTASR